jgi:hypothetical protein
MTGMFFLFLFLVVVNSAGIANGLGYSRGPWFLGWALLIAGSIAAILTVDSWAPVLPGIFGVAALNGLIISISGHALNQPTIPISPLIGVLFTVVMACASVATASFANRDLTNMDRAMYLGILFCFVAMMTCVMASVEHWEVPVCIGFLACIGVLSVRKLKPMR